MVIKIEHIVDDCIGCGACAVVCDNWEMIGSKSHPKKTELDEVGCNKEAADVCPVGCIHIKH